MTHTKTPYFEQWPQIDSLIKTDPAIEQEITRILSLMTLEEKVGQMIQPELRDITPEEIIEYKIGSILNGGGSWPDNNKQASANEWTAKADLFWHATEKMFADRPFRIPFFWLPMLFTDITMYLAPQYFHTISAWAVLVILN